MGRGFRFRVARNERRGKKRLNELTEAANEGGEEKKKRGWKQSIQPHHRLWQERVWRKERLELDSRGKEGHAGKTQEKKDPGLARDREWSGQLGEARKGDALPGPDWPTEILIVLVIQV